MTGEPLGPQHVALAEPGLDHPAAQLMLERAATESQRGEREDEHTIALAVEGGAAAGMVVAGMCGVLESAGLINAVDRMYGTSAGAIMSAYTASGQAAIGATIFPKLMVPEFASPVRSRWRFLTGKPAVNFGYLYDDVMGIQAPYDFEGLARGPEFAALSVNLKTLEPEVLRDFENTEELMLALRASSAMPVLSGPPFMYHGRPMTDGAMLVSVPFRMALEEGATHVLALRSRGENYRKDPYSRSDVFMARRKRFGGMALAHLLEVRPGLYNRDADELQYGNSSSVLQIAPAGPDEEPVEQMEKSLSRLREGFRLGAAATAKVFGMPEIEVDWGQFPPTIVAKQAV
jgi:predicted patatin/cPLA2 family phospholipase